jgi:hypothetical protein
MITMTLVSFTLILAALFVRTQRNLRIPVRVKVGVK